MVLTSAVNLNTANISVGLLSSSLLAVFYITTWLSPVNKRRRERLKRWDRMLTSWEGIPAQPGFDAVPGVPERLKSVEDIINIKFDKVAVLEQNQASIYVDLKAARQEIAELKEFFMHHDRVTSYRENEWRKMFVSQNIKVPDYNLLPTQESLFEIQRKFAPREDSK